MKSMYNLNVLFSEYCNDEIKIIVDCEWISEVYEAVYLVNYLLKSYFVRLFILPGMCVKFEWY